jgi:LmbE family N-acetylglucosaminyl deacetylase
MKLFFSPHNDDETLFGAFTIQREYPLVVVVFDGFNQQNRGAKITADQRRAETIAAMSILGASVEFMGLRDDRPPSLGMLAEEFRRRYGDKNIEAVFAPAYEKGGNELHNLVSRAADQEWADILRHYKTYTTAGKSKGFPVPKTPEWIADKLRALACYSSQIAEPSTQEHFLRDLYEYYAE